MSTPHPLASPRFPRAAAYHPDWLLSAASGGANPLWLTEWLCEALDLRPGQRVLDLGCGLAASSIFLRREFGVQVWATDLWFGASQNLQRIRDAGMEDGVFPIHADARALPFAAEFFDAIVSIDSYLYYGTDDMYLADLARFVKPGGLIGMAGAGLMHEMGDGVPDHLQAWWSQERPTCFHSADWWRRHWQRSGIVDVELADSLEGGWQFWRDWLNIVAPGNVTEIKTVETDAGRSLGYVRAICRRRPGVELMEPITSVPAEYVQHPLLRDMESKLP